MGEDLTPKKIRYLLLPNKQFYKETTNQLYKEYYEMVLNGLSAPPLSAKQREGMQKVLEPLVFPDDNDGSTGLPKSNAIINQSSIYLLFLTLLIIVLG